MVKRKREGTECGPGEDDGEHDQKKKREKKIKLVPQEPKKRKNVKTSKKPKDHKKKDYVDRKGHETAETKSKKYHEIENDTTKQWKVEGSQFCPQYDQMGVCCMFHCNAGDDTLERALKNLLIDTFCTKRGACEKEKKCVRACKRYSAYRIAAAYLHYKERTPLPICVRLWITEKFGKGTTGFQVQKDLSPTQSQNE